MRNSMKTNENKEQEPALSSIEGFRDYLLQKGFSNNTIESYKRAVDNFEKWAAKESQSLESMRQADILHYVQLKKRSMNQGSISKEVNSLKHYYNYLIAIDILTENPTSQIKIKGIRRNKLYQILKREELESIYNNFETLENPTNKRNKVILGLIIYQGLGAIELSRLEEKDLKLREGKIYITGTRKSNERTLKLEAHQMLDMMEYQLKTRKEILEQSKKESDKLLVSTGTSDRFNNIMQILMKKLKKQNPKINTLKQIRTSVITHWLKIHNLRQVQYMAGHRYVSSTESYLINDLDDLTEEINKYHPVN